MTSEEISKLKADLYTLSNLESQTSPENFWRDGEKPNTVANRKAWAALQKKQDKLTAEFVKTVKKMTLFETAKLKSSLTEREVIFVKYLTGVVL